MVDSNINTCISMLEIGLQGYKLTGSDVGKKISGKIVA